MSIRITIDVSIMNDDDDEVKDLLMEYIPSFDECLEKMLQRK